MLKKRITTYTRRTTLDINDIY